MQLIGEYLPALKIQGRHVVKAFPIDYLNELIDQFLLLALV